MMLAKKPRLLSDLWMLGRKQYQKEQTFIYTGVWDCAVRMQAYVVHVACACCQASFI